MQTPSATQMITDVVSWMIEQQIGSAWRQVSGAAELATVPKTPKNKPQMIILMM